MAKPTTPTPRTFRRVLAVAVAGATFGLTGAAAIAATAGSGSAGTCRPSEADLLRAAYAARQLEAEHPELFEQSPRPAGYDDLRLAAEWARRLEVLSPQDQC